MWKDGHSVTPDRINDRQGVKEGEAENFNEGHQNGDFAPANPPLYRHPCNGCQSAPIKRNEKQQQICVMTRAEVAGRYLEKADEFIHIEKQKVAESLRRRTIYVYFDDLARAGPEAQHADLF